MPDAGSSPSVAGRRLGVSGRAMLDALVTGTTDPAVLAEHPARHREPNASCALAHQRRTIVSRPNIMDRYHRDPTRRDGRRATSSAMVRRFFSGFVKIHILHHATEEPVYGLALIAELGRHGYALSAGTLYPLLHALEQDGYLRCRRRIIDGKVRKYYRATRAGRRALAAARRQITELVKEVLVHDRASHPTDGRRAPRALDGRRARGAPRTPRRVAAGG